MGTWWSRSCLARLFAPFFSLRRHPYPFLRECVCLAAVVQVPEGPDTEYSAATVSQTLGRLNQIDAPPGRPSPLTLSDWPCVREDLFFCTKKGRCNRCSCISFSWGFPRAPSAFAVASARTRWRSHLGPSEGEGAKGRPPSVEPEPRSCLTPLVPSVSSGVGHRSRRVVGASPCAR